MPAVSGRTSASVAVTRGLLQTLSRDELEAVLAHEMAHIRNRDVRLMVVAVVFVGILAFGAQILTRSLWDRPRDGRAGQPLGAVDFALFAVAALLASIASLFSVLTKLAISRTREFVADAGAVALTKNPDALISALRRIAGHEEIAGLPAALQAMMISSRLDGLWSTHPSVDQRVAALETFAGGRAAALVTKEAMLLARRGRPVGAQSPLPQQASFGRRKRQTASSPMGT